jgi:PPP family 3-phenylpropionic acid transporter
LIAVFVVMFSLWSAALPLFEANVIAAVDGDSGRYGRIRLWGSVGFIIAVLLAGLALDHLPMKSMRWMVLAMLVLAAFSARALPEHRPGPAQETGHDSIWPILRRPEVAALFMACFLMMASQGANFVFYSIYMVENGHSKSTVGILWSVGVIAEIAIFLSLPTLNKRFTPYALFSFSFGVTALRYLLVGWFPASLFLQLLAQSFHAFTFGAWHSAAMAMLHQWFPAPFGTRGQALYTSFSFGLGGAVGGIVAGLAWDVIGPAWLFTAMSVLSVVGWGVSLRFVRTASISVNAPKSP